MVPTSFCASHGRREKGARLSTNVAGVKDCVDAKKPGTKSTQPAPLLESLDRVDGKKTVIIFAHAPNCSQLSPTTLAPNGRARAGAAVSRAGELWTGQAKFESEACMCLHLCQRQRQPNLQTNRPQAGFFLAAAATATLWAYAEALARRRRSVAADSAKASVLLPKHAQPATSAWWQCGLVRCVLLQQDALIECRPVLRWW